MAQRVSLGLIEGPAHTRDVTVEPWIEDELVMALPASDEWDNSRDIEMIDLKGVRLLMRERGSGTREIVEQTMAEHGLAMKDSRRAIRRALLLGTLKMVPIRGLDLKRQFSIVYSRGPEPTGLPGLFLNHLREETHQVPSPAHIAPKRIGRSKK